MKYNLMRSRREGYLRWLSCSQLILLDVGFLYRLCWERDTKYWTGPYAKMVTSIYNLNTFGMRRKRRRHLSISSSMLPCALNFCSFRVCNYGYFTCDRLSLELISVVFIICRKNFACKTSRSECTHAVSSPNVFHFLSIRGCVLAKALD